VLGVVVVGALLVVVGYGSQTQRSCGSAQISSENGNQYFLQPTAFSLLRDCFVDAYRRRWRASIALREWGVDTLTIQRYRIDGFAVYANTFSRITRMA